MNLDWFLSKPMPLAIYIASCEFIVIYTRKKGIWRCGYHILSPCVCLISQPLVNCSSSENAISPDTLAFDSPSSAPFIFWLLQTLTPRRKECLIVSCMGAYSVSQSCWTLCNPMDGSLPGSSLHGILQARMMEWVAISSSRGSSQPRDGTWISCFFCIGRQILYPWATWEPLSSVIVSDNRT